MKNSLKVTCTEKYVLIDKTFKFDFPTQYTEYNHLSQKEFEQQVYDQDILIISELEINSIILEHNPHLKLVALCSTGYNHVDLNLLAQHHIKVCNIRNYASDAVAEHAFAMMIFLVKNFALQISATKNGLWSQSSSAFYLAAPMTELKHKTLVILGKGEIGLSLAHKAEAFGMRVLFSERKHALVCRSGYISFEDAIRQADILSLHCELNSQTKHIIDDDVLSKMKSGSYLINVGRGELINDTALINAITCGKLAGFATDTLNQEPPVSNHPLIKLQQDHDNVILTAHIAWATQEAQIRLFDVLEHNINQNMKGHDLNLIHADSSH